jgi:class 3 adenylate cyclase
VVLEEIANQPAGARGDDDCIRRGQGLQSGGEVGRFADDRERAVRAGLAVVEAVGGLNGPQRLRVHIGVATGLVVVGDLIGEGSAQEQSSSSCACG